MTFPRSIKPKTTHAARPKPKPEAEVKKMIDHAGCILYPSLSRVASIHFQKPFGV